MLKSCGNIDLLFQRHFSLKNFSHPYTFHIMHFTFPNLMWKCILSLYFVLIPWEASYVFQPHLSTADNNLYYSLGCIILTWGDYVYGCNKVGNNLIMFPIKEWKFYLYRENFKFKPKALRFGIYRINHKFSHFTFMSLWAFFIIKVLQCSSKISISWQCWLILLPNVPDSWRCNLYTFFFLHLLDLRSTSIGE